MNAETWNEIISLAQSSDASLSAQGQVRLRDHASAEDVSKLLDLLRGDDTYLREVAVMPLIEAAGPSVLPELFAAYERGVAGGLDNGHFHGPFMHLPELYPSETKAALVHLRKTGSPAMSELADWLLEFVGGDANLP